MYTDKVKLNLVVVGFTGLELDNEVDRPDVVSIERPFLDMVTRILVWWVVIQWPAQDMSVKGNCYGAFSPMRR